MFGILAAIAFAVAYILDIAKSNPPIALTPTALTVAGLFFLSLHLIGVGTGWSITRKP